MNKTYQYIFNLYHYLLNFRDTMAFILPREHTVQEYEGRKEILYKGIEEGSALGNFFEQNKEKGEELKNKIKECLEDLYGDSSTILVKSGDKIRVDNTQNIKILDYVTGLSESIRDIIYGYLLFAKKKNENNPDFERLLILDDQLYRVVHAMLSMGEFEKSFSEFQKVMKESHGEKTPQANFIVQNEIAKVSGLIRFSRAHAHCIDNKTLDLLDDVEEALQNAEGRRERRDNNSFDNIFSSLNKKLNEYVGTKEKEWKESYDKMLQEALKYDEENKKAQA